MSSYARIPLRTEPWPSANRYAQPCPICEKPWTPWTGSLLPCHARCLLDETGQIKTLELYRTAPHLNYVAIAAELGVSMGVIKATLHAHGIRMR